MGNTLRLMIAVIKARDHPHIYGEYNVSILAKVDYIGSPPYIWGILDEPGTGVVEARITPIYMGNTRCFTKEI